MASDRERQRETPTWMAKTRCPADDLILFLRQLQIMLKSGVPLVNSLDTLSEREDQPKFGRAISELAKRVSHGHTMSHAMQLFPKLFDGIIIGLVSVGEETGQLTDVLDRLATWKERDLSLANRVRSALVYPVLVLLLSVVLTGVLFYWVLPEFITIFNDMDAELPPPTQLLVFLTDVCSSTVFQLTSLVIVCASTYAIKTFADTDHGRLTLWRIGLMTPLLDVLLERASTARFAAAVAMMLDSGMPLPRSLRLGAQASGNAVYQEDVKNMVQAIMHGTPVGEYMASRPDLYSQTWTKMTSTGEEASQLSDMLERVAEMYDREVSNHVDFLLTLLEPALLAGVASIVGFVLISVFLPLYSQLDKF
jgi:type IV pilus assembly protein PilC